MKKTFADIIWPVVLWGIFVGILVSLFFYSNNRDFDPDEFEHMHTAWKIARGQEIFVDFFQHHHPFFDYMITPVIHTFGDTVESIFISRYVMLLLMAGILTATYLLSVRIFKHSEIGVLSLILTSTFIAFFEKAIEIRPDVPQTLMGLLAIYFLFAYYDEKSLRKLIASAVCLAASYLFLQKAVELIIPIGALLLYDVYKKRVCFRDAALYSAVFILTLLPYYIYLLIGGSFERYFEVNWLVNYYIPQVLSKLVSVITLFKENTVTCVLYFVGVIALIRTGKEWRFATFSICLIIIPIILFKNLWKQYFMLVIPPVAIITSYAIYSTFNSRLSKFIVILGGIYIPLAYMHNYGFFNMNNDNQRAQLDKIEYVLSIAEDGDKVYDGNATFNLFHDDIDYFWFCVGYCLDSYKKISDYRYNIYTLIASQRPKVISNTEIPNFNDMRIKNKYKVSDKYQDLYIRVD